MRASDNAKIVVWRLYDGKPGHDRQSAGLVRALATATALEECVFDIRNCHVSVGDYFFKRLPFAVGAPDPDLIIGAGRRCQWPLVAARRARPARTVYLMKPLLPKRCFDLCLIPRHDGPTASPRVIITDGVLNDVHFRTSNANDGLVLIGGPSEHYGWDALSLKTQIKDIIDAAPEKKWVIADSRRTPPDTIAALECLLRDNVTLMPSYRSAPDRLRVQFEQSDLVWVTRDSVSMIYEALTAGAAVGVLEIPAKRKDRITSMVDDLAARGMITPYAEWRAGTEPQAGPPLAEAARCAAIILTRMHNKEP